MAEITLLVPCYNAVRTLPRLLESVAAQTEPFAGAFFYDDGSTDDTGEFLRARGLTVVQDGTNRGPAHARNRLLAAARSPWVHFHDADDLLAPAFVERMSTLLVPEVDVAVCDCDWLREEDRKMEIAWRFDGGRLARDAVEANLIQPCPLIACVFRPDLLRQVGGFDENLPTWEDADLQLRLAQAGARYRLLPEVLSVALRHSRGASANLTHLSECHARILEKFADSLPARHHPTIAAEAEKLATLLFAQRLEPAVAARCLALCRRLGWAVPSSRHPLVRAARAVLPGEWLLRVQTRYRASRPGPA